MKKITISFLSLIFFASLTHAQLISTYACNGVAGFSGDGGQATAAETSFSYGIVLDAAGNLYIADQANARVRKVTAAGIISTIGGTGVFGFSGDGGQATAAQMGDPSGVAVDAAGNVYVGDVNNNRIRKIAPTGIITTVVGNGTPGFSGDGGQATAAEINNAYGVWSTPTGVLYVGDYANHRIRKVAIGGIISTVAGNGTAGWSGDGGQATAGELNYPDQIITDAAGNLYISDYGNNRVRKVTPTGILSTIAGTGVAGYNGDGIQATAAQINGVESVAIDAGGNLYLADLNERIRRINPAGVISTYAGNGVAGYNGDGIQATTAEINLPTRVATDAAGNIYIGDELNNRIRKVGGVPLPVTWLTFTADYNSMENNVLLNWATATEINNNYFTIERSTDGETFNEIGQLKGAGNSSHTLYYSTTDLSPIPGTDYYRIKQTDYDGNIMYSSIQSVGVPFTFEVYPNPAHGSLTIRFGQEGGNTTITLFNLLGEKVLSKYTQTNAGQSFTTSVTTLPAGIYLLKVQTEGGMQMVKRVEIMK